MRAKRNVGDDSPINWKATMQNINILMKELNISNKDIQ